MQSSERLRQTQLRATVRPGQQHRLERLLIEWFTAVPQDGATAVVVVVHTADVVEEETFVEEVEQLDGGLVDGDAGTASVEQCHVQHGDVVAGVFSKVQTNKHLISHEDFLPTSDIVIYIVIYKSTQ